MKGNIKKLAVFVMIAAMAMFTAVTMASAGDRDDHQKAIIGEYGFTGGGNCISTPSGNWLGDFQLTDPTKVSGSSYNVHGTLIFKKNGTGTIDFMTVGTPIPPAWSPTYSHATYPFTYTVTDDGEFTFAAVPNTFTSTYFNPLTGAALYSVIIDQYHLTGWVSADHKTIVVATPAPEIRTVSLPNGVAIQKLICHDSHVCTRLGEVESWPDRR